MALEMLKFERACLYCRDYPEKYHGVPSKRFRELIEKRAYEFIDSVPEVSKETARLYTKRMKSLALLELRRHRKGKTFPKITNALTAEALTLRQQLKEFLTDGVTG